jgi:electron transport complex protein RnfB
LIKLIAFYLRLNVGNVAFRVVVPMQNLLLMADSINKCPPGGQSTINAIANLLDVPAPELDQEHGEEADIKTVAYIREDECIGCTKCIQACPVDAILGAAKLMHTVIADECTGCDLCVEPCPVDCIDMLPVESGVNQWQWPTPPIANGLIATDRTHSNSSHEGAA